MLSRFIFLGVLFSFLVACNKPDEKVIDTAKYEAELGQHAQDYMMGLKSVLVANMQAGGPLQAVNVCSDTAQQMSVLYSETMKVKVKRASFKNRNEQNVPDEFEAKAIKLFEELKIDGELTAKSNLVETATIDGEQIVRYAKPILIDAPCLNCHGTESQISNEVANVISEKYPNDKAKGYSIGDLRGVISVTNTL
jgi:hypothetical protein